MLYSPQTLFYTIFGSFMNIKFILFLTIAIIFVILHLVSKLISYILFPKSKSKSNIESLKENWLMLFYEELVYRNILFNILHNTFTVPQTIFITSIYSDLPRIIFILRVFLYSSRKESQNAKIRLALLIVKFLFSIFSGFVLNRVEGTIVMSL